MKATELRLGNKILYDGKVCTVDNLFGENLIRIKEVSVYEQLNHESFYTPIPLTEEWLLKMGFEISHANDHLYSINAVGSVFNVSKYKDKSNILEEYRHLNYNDFVVDIPSYYQEAMFYNFKFVHQIQNLYFALTAEELTIKETTNV